MFKHWKWWQRITKIQKSADKCYYHVAQYDRTSASTHVCLYLKCILYMYMTSHLICMYFYRCVCLCMPIFFPSLHKRPASSYNNAIQFESHKQKSVHIEQKLLTHTDQTTNSVWCDAVFCIAHSVVHTAQSVHESGDIFRGNIKINNLAFFSIFLSNK